LVSPVMVIGLVVPVAVIFPGFEVTVYPVIALPPFDAGAVKLTVACALPAVALTAVGASEVVYGVTAADAVEALLGPAALVALTVNVYAVPLVRPTIVIGLVVPVAVIFPGFEVTVYPVIALPPFDAGAVKLTIACALPAVALTAVGASGVVYGVTAADAVEALLEPAALVALTVNVYAVPLVRPTIVIGLVVPVAVIFPGFEVTVYPVIVLPPFDAGAVKLTVACALLAVAFTAVGASGVVYGVTVADAVEALPVPVVLVALTVNVYAVPLVRPTIVIGLAEPVAVIFPGFEVTVYPVIVLPPLKAGAMKLTVACPFPATAETAVGTLGTPSTVTKNEPTKVPST